MTDKRLGEANTEAEQEIETVLRMVPQWRDRAVSYAPVHGGISNSNWRVRLDSEPHSYFVKVPGRGTEMFIDRGAAFEASKRAEALGIGPRTYDYVAHEGIEICDFIEGRRACSNRDFQQRDIRTAAVGLYRAFNNSDRLSLTKTVFDMIEEHVEQVRELKGEFPTDFAWLYRQYKLAREALEASGIDLVPCFNDPMAGNFLLGEDRSLMLIDYEYASNNDRCYDLAIWSGEMFFSEQIEAEIIEEYFGRMDPRVKARIVVHRALADVKWSTWAMVQNKVSALDFDFYKYGAWKHMRARAVMHDTRWPEYLAAV